MPGRTSGWPRSRGARRPERPDAPAPEPLQCPCSTAIGRGHAEPDHPGDVALLRDREVVRELLRRRAVEVGDEVDGERERLAGAGRREDDAVGPLLLGRSGAVKRARCGPSTYDPLRSVDPGQHQGVVGPAEGSHGGSVGVEVGRRGRAPRSAGGQEVGCGQDLGAGEPERVAGRRGDGAVDAVADVAAAAQVLVHRHRLERARERPLDAVAAWTVTTTVVIDGSPLDGVVGRRRPDVAAPTGIRPRCRRPPT